MSDKRQFSLPATRRIVNAVRAVEGSNPDRKSRARIVAGDASLPTAQYQYMAYVMVSQNVSGWDFVRAHPVL